MEKCEKSVTRERDSDLHTEYVTYGVGCEYFERWATLYQPAPLEERDPLGVVQCM